MESLVQSFAKSINADPLDDFPKLMYADWLEEGGQSDLAQAWRVLVERGKVPILDYYTDFTRFRDWRFFPDPTAHKKVLKAIITGWIGYQMLRSLWIYGNGIDFKIHTVVVSTPIKPLQLLGWKSTKKLELIH